MDLFGYTVIELTAQISDATYYMLKLVELGNYYKSKGGLFEIPSYKCCRFETLHW